MFESRDAGWFTRRRQPAPTNAEWEAVAERAGLLDIDMLRRVARTNLAAVPAGPVGEAAAAHWPGQTSPFAGMRPGPELAQQLEESAIPGRMDATERVDRIDAWSRSIDAQQGELLAEIAAFMEEYPRDDKGRWSSQGAKAAVTELAMLLRVSSSTAEGTVGLASALAYRLPKTLEALRAGAVSLATAQHIARQTSHLEREQAAEAESRLYPDAFEQSPAEVRNAVRRAVADLDPELLRKRHEAERSLRRVELTPTADGMCWLSAYLPAPEALKAYGVIDAHARALGETGLTEGVGGTIDNRRADTLVDLILNPVGPRPRVSVQVRVVVPVGSVLGLTDEPGELAGYGPIPADLARELAQNATWRRLLTDPAQNEVLDLGTIRYKPSAALAERIIARDGTCRAPGCLVPAHRCDGDHTVVHRADGSGGSTSERVLACECRRHHVVRHLPGWKVCLNEDKTMTWHTPLDKIYTTKPNGFFPKRR